MDEDNVQNVEEIKVDAHNLYKEEIFTDLKVGTIKRLTPVKADGDADKSRAPIFMGQASVLTPAGPIPIQCPLEANNFTEAMENFPSAIKKAVEKMVEELKELQRKEASRIVVPGEEGKGKISLT